MNPFLQWFIIWLPACASLLILYFIIHRLDSRSRERAWQDRYRQQIEHDRSSKARLMQFLDTHSITQK